MQRISLTVPELARLPFDDFEALCFGEAAHGPDAPLLLSAAILREKEANRSMSAAAASPAPRRGGYMAGFEMKVVAWPELPAKPSRMTFAQRKAARVQGSVVPGRLPFEVESVPAAGTPCHNSLLAEQPPAGQAPGAGTGVPVPRLTSQELADMQYAWDKLHEHGEGLSCRTLTPILSKLEAALRRGPIPDAAIVGCYLRTSGDDKLAYMVDVGRAVLALGDNPAAPDVETAVELLADALSAEKSWTRDFSRGLLNQAIADALEPSEREEAARFTAEGCSPVIRVSETHSWLKERDGRWMLHFMGSPLRQANRFERELLEAKVTIAEALRN